MIDSSKKISKKLFIFSSFFALIFLFLVLFFFSISKSTSNYNGVEDRLVNNNTNGFAYLNENFRQNDPYITRNPDLNTMLVGPIISNLDPSKGNEGAKVNLVIFSDFECDYCYKQEAILEEIEREYEGKIKIIWKDYPSGDTNSSSYLASLAARCAQDQDKFWEYHDLLFEVEGIFDSNILESVAAKANLELVEYRDCFDKQTGRTRVRDNILEANALDIVGVPFMYVNSQEIMGEVVKEDLKKIIDVELSKIVEEDDS